MEIPLWRYRTGIVLFVLGSLKVPVSALLVAIALHKVAPFTMIIGQAMSVAAIVVLGKQGFKEIRRRVLKFFRWDHTRELHPVSKFRHIAGLMFVTVVPFLMQATATIFAVISHTAATYEHPFPEVWGMAFDMQLRFFLGLMIGAEVCVIIGLFMLGGLWWERFRKLFVWPGKNWEPSAGDGSS